MEDEINERKFFERNIMVEKRQEFFWKYLINLDIITPELKTFEVPVRIIKFKCVKSEEHRAFDQELKNVYQKVTQVKGEVCEKIIHRSLV